MPVSVIGMHRSGTSMVAGLLSIAGLDLGSDERLLASDEGNASGYWENLELQDLNERILQRFDGTWYDPPKLDRDWTEDPAVKECRADARRCGSVFGLW